MLKNKKLFLFDMDGTLYIGSELFDFTKELLAKIKSNGNRYLFVTNNSSKSVDAYIEKLANFGIQVTEDDFVTSSQATAYYLNLHHPDKTLYVCGTESLKKEMIKGGFTITEDLDQVECIVMGYDTELTPDTVLNCCIWGLYILSFIYHFETLGSCKYADRPHRRTRRQASEILPDNQRGTKTY